MKGLAPPTLPLVATPSNEGVSRNLTTPSNEGVSRNLTPLHQMSAPSHQGLEHSEYEGHARSARQVEMLAMNMRCMARWHAILDARNPGARRQVMGQRCVRARLVMAILSAAMALISGCGSETSSPSGGADASDRSGGSDASRAPDSSADPAVEARRAVVAASHPLAAKAGAKVLSDGGNAIDAAAAILFALNVVEPQSSGIGGGGFMMVHRASTNETLVVDSLETAPAAASADMLREFSFRDGSTSGISVGVPGQLLGIATALQQWGTMPLARVLEPAISLASDGFGINAVLASDIVDSTARGVVLTSLQPETAAVFQPNGEPLGAGDTLVQPELAKTFKLIAQHGPDVFYKGEIAEAIVNAQLRTRTGEAGKGRMTLADLAGYRPVIRQPLRKSYRGFTVLAAPPPSAGGLMVLQTLKLAERFPLGDKEQGFGFGTNDSMHVLVEALRLAFADRSYWLGDADFAKVPVEGLLAESYVRDRSALIHSDSVMDDPSPGTPSNLVLMMPSRAGVRAIADTEGVNTTHFAVIDRDGNVVSYTATIESVFGTGIMVPGYGFMLNNHLTDFNMKPTYNAASKNPGNNDIAPGKRPRSSMSPTMIFKDDKFVAAYGSPGGATIINSVVQVTVDVIDLGMSIEDAIGAARFAVTSSAGKMRCEAGPLEPRGFDPAPSFRDATLAALRTMGHDLDECTDSAVGAVQAVVQDLDTGKRHGGADGRREGTVLTVDSEP